MENTKTITHGFVDTQIINKLKELNLNDFFTDLENGYKEYNVEFTFEGRYKFNVYFEIRESTIKKDYEFFAIDIRTGEEVEFKIIHRGKATLLQERFDIFYLDFLKWIGKSDDRLTIMNDYKNHM